MPTSDRAVSNLRTVRQLPGNQSLWVPGEVWLQSWNLKELTEGHHQEWSLRLNLTQHGKSHQARTLEGLTDWELFLDSVGGGAWPFLVGGVICLVNSDNERDSVLLTSCRSIYPAAIILLEGLAASSRTRLSNNRSVMPLDVLGRTRYLVSPLLQNKKLSIYNFDCPWHCASVSLSHSPVLLVQSRQTVSWYIRLMYLQIYSSLPILLVNF